MFFVLSDCISKELCILSSFEVSGVVARNMRISTASNKITDITYGKSAHPASSPAVGLPKASHCLRARVSEPGFQDSTLRVPTTRALL